MYMELYFFYFQIDVLNLYVIKRSNKNLNSDKNDKPAHKII